MAAKKYKIKNTNILHDGSLRYIGEIIELEDKQAKKLQDVLIPVKETAPSANKTQTNKTQTKTNKTDNPEKTGGENGK